MNTMLPRLALNARINKTYQKFLNELKKKRISEEISTDFATRLSLATDNSIYQVNPLAVIFPRTTEDIANILALAHLEEFHEIQFCPRGGGTSTNGQSLSAGIMIDCSKYMRNILELNLKDGWVRVQSGVVLDQLNDYLRPHGVSFAPEISPSNRATIGGMVNTDACGIGSKILGRTSDHIIGLTCILNDGRILQTEQVNVNETLAQSIIKLVQLHQDLINEKFKSVPRTLNGYNLKKMFLNNELNLNYLFSGSEGTLGVISECKLKLTPIPLYRKLLVVKYRNFDDALQLAYNLNDVKPLVIEAIDEKLIELARQDPMYVYLKPMLDTESVKTGAVNLVEFVANDERELEEHVKHFCDSLSNETLGYYIAKNAKETKLLWDLRKKSVGLISKKQDGTRRPIPFIEDTAVPPENLAAYINEFKALLDHHHLMYGMYGHVDAGCVHVRPALDMKIESDQKLVKELSDKVVILVEKHGGVLWGEHGHGYRSEYGLRFFGKTLYHVVRQIKTLFDPYNQLNPGKIATAINSNETLVKVEGPMRGDVDKQIHESWRETFAPTIACNGNGACFNYATAEIMCPSYKVTRDRIHSPKGRATLMREWLRQLSQTKFVLDVNKRVGLIRRLFSKKSDDFSQEVYSAMAGCLSCKACATQCPLNVDVPDFKAKFLAYYHQRYLRSIRDYCIGFIEIIAPIQARFSRITNYFLKQRWVNILIRKSIKMVDLPLVAEVSIHQELQKRKAPRLDFASLPNLTNEQKSNSIILLQDTFTTFYEPSVLLSIYDFLTKLGYQVYVAPFFANGKPLHVNGFLRRFNQLVKENQQRLSQFATLNMPMIGIDPSMTLVYRDEYQKIFPKQNFQVQLIQEWLAKQPVLNSVFRSDDNQTLYLLSHCTEKALCMESEKQWQIIFRAFNLNLIPLSVGCCGMAGSYGHEVENVANSRALFDMDWKRYLDDHGEKIVSTGYSCRSQIKRMTGKQIKYPIQILNDLF